MCAPSMGKTEPALLAEPSALSLAASPVRPSRTAARLLGERRSKANRPARACTRTRSPWRASARRRADSLSPCCPGNPPNPTGFHPGCFEPFDLSWGKGENNLKKETRSSSSSNCNYYRDHHRHPYLPDGGYFGQRP